MGGSWSTTECDVGDDNPWATIALQQQQPSPPPQHPPTTTTTTVPIKLPVSVDFQSFATASRSFHFTVLAEEGVDLSVYYSGEDALMQTVQFRFIPVLSRQEDSSSSSSVVELWIDCDGTCFAPGRKRVKLGTTTTNSNLIDLEHVYGIVADTDCVVCLCSKSNTALQPCRHMCVCAECAPHFLLSLGGGGGGRGCPVCRAGVQSWVRVKE